MKEINGTLVLETIEEIVDPKHTALLVIDLQNDNSSPRGFMASKGVDISPITDIIPRVKRIIDEARRIGLLVIFARMTKSIDGSHETGSRLRILGKSLHPLDTTGFRIEGTWGNEVLDELEPKPNERQIIKYLPSSFTGTPLDLILRTRSIKTGVVTGVVTEGCVEGTVRDLEQYGYYPVVLSDCVCSTHKDLHDSALLVMSRRYDALTSAELLGIWRGRVSPCHCN